MKTKQIEQIKNIDDSERIRLLLEREKIAAERLKAWSTALSIFVPLLIAALTVFYNVRLQENRARIDFELKATEIVMSANSPTVAANKAAVLVELFPERLSTRFKEVFDKMYGKEPQ